jgi:hypothetical protein
MSMRHLFHLPDFLMTQRINAMLDSYPSPGRWFKLSLRDCVL